jgi:hypothetical protein
MAARPHYWHGHSAAPLVEGHSDLKPLVTHWVSSRIVPNRSRAPDAYGLVVPDVKPGHGLTRVLSFGSPSGRRD